MNHLTEKAFREADMVARQLGQLKYGINEVKIKGGIDEKTKLEALLGFKSEAENILQGLSDSVAEALYSLDKEAEVAVVGGGTSPSTVNGSGFCNGCGLPDPAHSTQCPKKHDLDKGL